jgi:hypothetical protein|tara:strand:- start:895 stop:1491 length:597 start_codon:yes stop_codon:yes gene_type:complete
VNSTVIPYGQLRYDCIDRLIYGSSGQWLHLGINTHRAAASIDDTSSDGSNALNYTQPTISNSNDLRKQYNTTSGLHIFCPRHLSARRICAAFKDLTGGWKEHALSTLGYPHSYEYEAPNSRFMEVDVPMRYALSKIIAESKAISKSKGGSNSNSGTNGTIDGEDLGKFMHISFEKRCLFEAWLLCVCDFLSFKKLEQI